MCRSDQPGPQVRVGKPSRSVRLWGVVSMRFLPALGAGVALASALFASSAGAAIVLDVGGPYYLIGLTSTTVAFDGSGSSSTTPGTLEFMWDFGDGAPSSPWGSASASHTYSYVPGRAFVATLVGRYVSDPNSTVSARAFIGPQPAPVVGVPEPATWALMMVAFGGLGAMMRRRRASFQGA
jgi:hypothetical protein